MDPKAWYKSKTVWINIASFAALALTLDAVGDIIPEVWVKPIAAVNAILNLAVRFLSGTQPPLASSQGAVDRSKGLAPLLVLALTLPLLSGCADRRGVVLVAQTGKGLSETILSAQKATKQWTDERLAQETTNDGKLRVVRIAQQVQGRLTGVQQRLEPVPDLLVEIDKAIEAGVDDAQRITAVLNILDAAGIEVDAVIGGFPVGETAADVLKATQEIRSIIAKIRDALVRPRPGSWILKPYGPVAE